MQPEEELYAKYMWIINEEKEGQKQEQGDWEEHPLAQVVN